MTANELANFDGKNGHKAYIAVSGKIYDVTDSPLWLEGNHQGEHCAGCDLTEELKGAPHVRAVIERFPMVGELTPSSPEQRKISVWLLLGGALGVLLVTLYLFLR